MGEHGQTMIFVLERCIDVFVSFVIFWLIYIIFVCHQSVASRLVGIRLNDVAPDAHGAACMCKLNHETQKMFRTSAVTGFLNFHAAGAVTRFYFSPQRARQIEIKTSVSSLVVCDDDACKSTE